MHQSKLISRRRSVVAPKRVLGLDPSLTSTGYAMRVEGIVRTGTIDTGELRGPRRLDYAVRQLEKILDRYQPDLVVYEDYAMGQGPKSGRVFDIGELGGVYKRLIWSRGIDMTLFAPTAMKKAICGKGNPGFKGRGKKVSEKEKKQPIVDALARDFDIHVPQYDEADAVSLMLLGEYQCAPNTFTKNAVVSARFAAAKDFSVVPGQLKSFAKMPNSV